MAVGNFGGDYRCLWRRRSNGHLCPGTSRHHSARGSGAHDRPGGRAYYGCGSSHDRSSGGATNPDNPCSRRSARF